MTRRTLEEQQAAVDRYTHETEQLQLRVLRANLRKAALMAVARGDKLPRCPKTGAVLNRNGVAHDGN